MSAELNAITDRRIEEHIAAAGGVVNAANLLLDEYMMTPERYKIAADIMEVLLRQGNDSPCERCRTRSRCEGCHA